MTTITQSPLFMDSPRSEAEDLGGGIYRTILGYDDKLLMAKIWFETGAIGAVHHHHHSQVTYFISGKFEVQVGDKKQIVGAGGCVFMPSDVPHGSVCIEEGILIDVFSPAREDFLAGEAYKT